MIYIGDAYKLCAEIKHYGVAGQKWGVRRYQNADGTLTEEGIRHRHELYDSLSDYNKEAVSDLDANLNKLSKYVVDVDTDKQKFNREKLRDIIEEIRYDESKLKNKATQFTPMHDHDYGSEQANTRYAIEDEISELGRIGKNYLYDLTKQKDKVGIALQNAGVRLYSKIPDNQYIGYLVKGLEKDETGQLVPVTTRRRYDIGKKEPAKTITGKDYRLLDEIVRDSLDQILVDGWGWSTDNSPKSIQYMLNNPVSNPKSKNIDAETFNLRTYKKKENENPIYFITLANGSTIPIYSKDYIDEPEYLKTVSTKVGNAAASKIMRKQNIKAQKEYFKDQEPVDFFTLPNGQVVPIYGY